MQFFFSICCFVKYAVVSFRQFKQTRIYDIFCDQYIYCLYKGVRLNLMSIIVLNVSLGITCNKNIDNFSVQAYWYIRDLL